MDTLAVIIAIAPILIEFLDASSVMLFTSTSRETRDIVCYDTPARKYTVVFQSRLRKISSYYRDKYWDPKRLLPVIKHWDIVQTIKFENFARMLSKSHLFYRYDRYDDTDLISIVNSPNPSKAFLQTLINKHADEITIPWNLRLTMTVLDDCVPPILAFIRIFLTNDEKSIQLVAESVIQKVTYDIDMHLRYVSPMMGMIDVSKEIMDIDEYVTSFLNNDRLYTTKMEQVFSGLRELIRFMDPQRADAFPLTFTYENDVIPLLKTDYSTRHYPHMRRFHTDRRWNLLREYVIPSPYYIENYPDMPRFRNDRR